MSCDIWASDTWQWWLEHGLDGIGAGIVGVLGLAATLWWDRRQRLRAASEAARGEGRTAVRQLLSAAVAGKNQLTGRSTREDVRKVVDEVRQVLAIENHVFQREAPLLANQCSVLMIGLQLGTTRRDGDPGKLLFVAGLALESVRRRCDEWMDDPAAYTGKLTEELETKHYKRPAREHVGDFATETLKHSGSASSRDSRVTGGD